MELKPHEVIAHKPAKSGLSDVRLRSDAEEIPTTEPGIRREQASKELE